MSVTLVRHTQPDVAPNVCYGRIDLDLADSFPDETRQVLSLLDDADRLFTSPLQRCRRLATEIGTSLDLEAKIDDRLQEMDFGTWEGRAWSDIPSTELDQWAEDFLNARPHGGESVAMLRARSRSVLDEYQAMNQRIIVVTHSGVIKCALAKGDTPRDFHSATDFGGVLQLPS